MARVIQIDRNQFPNLDFLVEGQDVSLTVTGKVISKQSDSALIAIRAILGRPSNQSDQMSELLGVQHQILGELKQLPKVAHLGNTGELL